MDQDGKHPDYDICSDIFNLILMIQNLLQVNVQKYQSMLLGSRAEANTINLHVDGVSIEQLKSIKLFEYTWTLNLILVSMLILFCKKAS